MTGTSAIDTLKRQGKIRWFGISTSDHASGIWSIEHGADLLQIEYDLLNPTAEHELLPLAARHNIGIMARTPLARGLLTGKFKAVRPSLPSSNGGGRAAIDSSYASNVSSSSDFGALGPDTGLKPHSVRAGKPGGALCRAGRPHSYPAGIQPPRR